MARSIKSKRGKMLRRQLRDRYKKKADEHLRKIVEKAKENDLLDFTYLVKKVKPPKMKEEDDKVEMEAEDSSMNENTDSQVDVKEEEAVTTAGSTSKDGHKPTRKMKYYNGNLESLRNKHGALPCWVSKREIRKQYVTKKIRIDQSKYRRSLKLM